jgi:hypothetical protein
MAAAKKTQTAKDNVNDDAQGGAGTNEEGNNENNENSDKRKTRGPQKVFYTCAAIKSVTKRDADGKVIKGEDGKNITEPTLIMDEYEVPSPTDKQFAMDRFEEQHGIKAQSASGPHYQVRNVAKVQTRIQVHVPLDKMNASGKVWSGVFQGWKVLAHGLLAFKDAESDKNKPLEYSDDEVVLIFPTVLANPEEKVPRPRFGGKTNTIMRSAVEELHIHAPQKNV